MINSQILIKKLSQKAAMFGIDARITLLITAIAAFAVSINKIANIDQEKIKESESVLSIIQKSIIKNYAATYTIPTDLQDLIDDGHLYLNDKSTNIDLWDNAYGVSTIIVNENIAHADVDTKYIAIYSTGKNGVLNTTMPTTVTEFENLTASGDDVIRKFSTYNSEVSFVEQENKQLDIISKLLRQYADKYYFENKELCLIVGNQLDATCDVDENGTYESNEEVGLIYLPKEYDDSTSKYYVVSGAEFKSGYINKVSNQDHNMYSFMSLIGGSEDYTVSPRNLVLHFTTNKYDNIKSPYIAEIWYGDEVTVF